MDKDSTRFFFNQQECIRRANKSIEQYNIGSGERLATSSKFEEEYFWQNLVSVIAAGVPSEITFIRNNWTHEDLAEELIIRGYHSWQQEDLMNRQKRK